MKCLRLILTIGATFAANLAFATPPTPDHTWSNAFGNPAIDQEVNCSVRWRGGVVVGGIFTLAGVVPAQNLAWWDGTNWRDLGGGVNGPVHALAVVHDTLVVAGDFTQAGGLETPGIARWTGGEWIHMGAGFTGGSYGGVHALVTYRDTLIAVGGFAQSGFAPMGGAAWWDGAAWHALGGGFDLGAGRVAAVYRDRLYVAGNFSSVEGAPARGLASWNGAHWSPVPWGTPPPSPEGNGINALAVAHDRLYVGGNFFLADTVAAVDLATWDENAWSAVPPLYPYGYGVTALAVHANTLVVAAFLGGLWNWDGAQWIYSGGNLGTGNITSLLADDVGSVVTGSIDANRPGTTEKAGYKVLVSSGGDWSPLQTWSSTMHGFLHGAGLQALVRYGTDIVAVGEFESVADGVHWERVDGLARWDGSGWHAFPGRPAGPGVGTALAVAGDTLIVTGSFFNEATSAFDIPGYRFDGAQWTQLDTLSSYLRSPTHYRGGLYYGASLHSGNVLQSGGVYRLDGTHWTRIADVTSPYNNPYVSALAVHDDRLVVSGWFDHIDGVPVTNVAAWDGETWAPFGEFPSIFSSPRAIAFAELDTTLYAAGNFSPDDNAVMRWDGSAWQPMGPTGVATGITVVGGQLHVPLWEAYGPSPVTELMRWEGGYWNTVGRLNYVVQMMLPDAGSLWLVGGFTMADGVPSSNIARLDPRTAPTSPGIALSPGVPNPSRGAVAFSYTLPTEGDVFLTVSDASGRHVATIANGPRDAGAHAVQWDGRGDGGQRLPAGLYFVRLVLPGGDESGRKVVLLP